MNAATASETHEHVRRVGARLDDAVVAGQPFSCSRYPDRQASSHENWRIRAVLRMQQVSLAS